MSLEIERLVKSYGAQRAVNDISLSVSSGESVVLLGPSGCGKTTTLNCIAGLEKPDAGRITVNGRTVVDIAGGIMLPPEARGLGMVFQAYATWPHMTVAQHIAYGLRLRKRSAEQINGRVEELVELLELNGLEHRLPAQLSGGQQQRVAVARALAYEPDVILYDEPLSNLDARLRTETRKELRRVQRETGITAVYVTHDQQEAFALADRIVLMREGRIEQIGTPSELFDKPASAYAARFIGETNMLKGRLVERTTGGAVVGLEGGLSIRGRVIDDVQVGEEATATVRAHRVQLSHQKLPLENALQASVVDVEYQGEYAEVRVNTGSVVLTARVYGELLYAVGDSVWVHIPVDGVQVYRVRAADYKDVADASGVTGVE